MKNKLTYKTKFKMENENSKIVETKALNIDDVRRSLNEKQKEVLKMFDAGYGMRKEGDQLYMYTNTDRKIPLDFEVDIKPFHEMKLIKNHSTMLDFVYLNLNEDGKMVYK